MGEVTFNPKLEAIATEIKAKAQKAARKGTLDKALDKLPGGTA